MMNQERIEKLKELLLQDPTDSFSRYALALEYNGLGQMDDAIATLQDLIERDPNYVAAYQQLGQIFHRLNRTKEAKEILRRGIDVADAAGDSHAAHEMDEELEDLEDEW